MFEPNPQHLTKEAFDKYYDAVPPWEIGAAQPAIVQLIDEGRVIGKVIDIGCGTGELALELSRRGFAVTGIDSSSRAIDRARAKAISRGLKADFRVHDALALQELGTRFDTAIDCGLFHVFTDNERLHYVRRLAEALEPNGLVILLCFSEGETRPGGPRRVTRAELEASFSESWSIERIEPARFESLLHSGGAAAWRAIARRMAINGLQGK